MEREGEGEGEAHTTRGSGRDALQWAHGRCEQDDEKREAVWQRGGQRRRASAPSPLLRCGAVLSHSSPRFSVGTPPLANSQ